MGQYLCLLLLTLSCLLFTAITRPFRSKLNNFRSILILVLLIGLFIIDIILVGTKTYIYELEVAGIVVVCAILVVNAVLLVCQFVNSYSEEIEECVKPCIMRYRLGRKKLKREESAVSRELVVENLEVVGEPEQKKPEEPERLDAFF